MRINEFPQEIDDPRLPRDGPGRAQKSWNSPRFFIQSRFRDPLRGPKGAPLGRQPSSANPRKGPFYEHGNLINHEIFMIFSQAVDIRPGFSCKVARAALHELYSRGTKNPPLRKTPRKRTILRTSTSTKKLKFSCVVKN